MPSRTGPAPEFYGVYARSADNVWVVGSCGTALHFNGGVWCPVPTDVSVDLLDVCSAGGKTFVVGEAGTILRR